MAHEDNGSKVDASVAVEEEAGASACSRHHQQLFGQCSEEGCTDKKRCGLLPAFLVVCVVVAVMMIAISGRLPARGNENPTDAAAVAASSKIYRGVTKSALMRSYHRASQPRAAESADQGGRTVVIVGAGYAGWGAARRLVEGGVRVEDVTMLEADEDLGGRTKANDGDGRFMPFPLDVGASYVHGSFRGELADLAGVDVEDLPLARGFSGWYLWKAPMTYHRFLSRNLASKLLNPACESYAKCKTRAEELGIERPVQGDYSNLGLYGCFSKKGRAYWGRGGSIEQREAELDGAKQRSK